MSVSSRSAKAVMYSEIERLRTQSDMLSQDLRATQYELRCSHLRSKELEATIADLSDQKSRASRPAPSTKQSLAQFCAAYCQTYGVRSVPGSVVQAWRDAQ